MANNPKQNYFTRNIQSYGTEDFLAHKNSSDFEYDGVTIMRELAMGRIDLELQGHFFLDKRFLDALINVASVQMSKYSILSNGMHCYQAWCQCNGAPFDEAHIEVLNRTDASAQVFKIIYDGLSMLRDTEDFKYLKLLTNQLVSNNTLKRAIQK